MKPLSIVAAFGALVFGLTASSNSQQQTAREQIGAVVAGSSCARVSWSHGQGRAELPYLTGVSLVFAKSVCHADRDDVKVVSAARGEPGTDAGRADALTWYERQFRAAHMSNDEPGLDTLRHTYVLLMSLGMQESSGRYCVGRDRSQGFSSADSAEAGILQTSWGVNRKHESLAPLFAHYKANPQDCWLDDFKWDGLRCSAWDAKTWGEGEGAEWQELTKSCPAFAVEYGAVVMRVSGGGSGEFGPLRRRRAEIAPKCDAMLAKVQELVKAKPEICANLE